LSGNTSYGKKYPKSNLFKGGIPVGEAPNPLRALQEIIIYLDKEYHPW
jgi:hypothetical protein